MESLPKKNLEGISLFPTGKFSNQDNILELSTWQRKVQVEISLITLIVTFFMTSRYADEIQYFRASRVEYWSPKRCIKLEDNRLHPS